MKIRLAFSISYPEGKTARSLEDLVFLEHDLYNILFHTVAGRSLKRHSQSPYFVFQVLKITKTSATIKTLLGERKTLTLNVDQAVSLDLNNLGILSLTLKKIEN